MLLQRTEALTRTVFISPALGRRAHFKHCVITVEQFTNNFHILRHMFLRSSLMPRSINCRDEQSTFVRLVGNHWDYSTCAHKAYLGKKVK